MRLEPVLQRTGTALGPEARAPAAQRTSAPVEQGDVFESVEGAAASFPAPERPAPGKPGTRWIDPNEPEGRPLAKAAQRHLARLGLGGGTIRSILRDELGIAHVRVERRHLGMRVFGEHALVHLRGTGPGDIEVTGNHGVLPTSLPELSREAHQQALAVAQARLRAESGVGEVVSSRMEPVIYRRPDGSYARGFFVQLEGRDGAGPVEMEALVDGESARVTASWHVHHGFVPPDVMREAEARKRSRGKGPGRGEEQRPARDAPIASPSKGPAAPGKGRTGHTHGLEIAASAARTATGATETNSEPAPRRADDRSLYSGVVDLLTRRRDDGTYVLHDTTRGDGIHTVDAGNPHCTSFGCEPFEANEIVDHDDRWGQPQDSDRQHGAIDAHFGGTMTYDALFDVLGIHSFDLRGGLLRLQVHMGKDWVQASWDGQSMIFGDGDRELAGPLVALDITGHEVTHGLTDHTADLLYRDQSGALNESFSDIGGVLVEWYAAQRYPHLKWNWTLGEAAWTPTNGDPNDGLRYLDAPERDGKSLSHFSQYQDDLDVHHTSGIANHAFYQLAETSPDKRANAVSGAKVEQGIGVDKAAKIFFRALVYYLTPSSGFAEARAATLRAAADLFGEDSVEVAKVGEAWDVVGVTSDVPSANMPAAA